MQGKANDSVRAGETPGARWLGAPSRRKILLGIGLGFIVLLVFLLVAWPLLAWCAFTFTGRSSLASGEGAAWAAWVQSFISLEALVTCVATATAIGVYLHEKKKKKDEDARAKSQSEESKEAKLIQLIFKDFDRFWSLCYEFDESVDGLAADGVPGKALQCLTERYLAADFEEPSDEAAKNASNELDDEFMRDCKKFGIPDAAKKLWKIFNWIRFFDVYFKSAAPHDAESIARMHSTVVDKMSMMYMNPMRRFVFGKYRHLEYGLSNKSVSRSSYRGIGYADAVLRYPKSLELLPDCDDVRSLVGVSERERAELLVSILKHGNLLGKSSFPVCGRQERK